MNIYDKVWELFSLDSRPIDELIEISSLIDTQKGTLCLLDEKQTELQQIASIIVALINENSTTSIGNQWYNTISELIVKHNQLLADANNGKALYEKLMSVQSVGRYTIQRHSQGYRFILKAASGEVLAASELYTRIESCLNGIEAMRRNSNGEIDDQTQEQSDRVSNPKYELYTDRAGEYRFRLKSRNGEVLAVSEGFVTKQSCMNTIESVKMNAKSEFVEKT